MNYRSLADLSHDIRDWIPELPPDVDLIVGVPRSGLLAATMMALYMNLPLTDVEGLCEGRILRMGHRLDEIDRPDLAEPLRILVVDDSVCSGSQMQEIKLRLKNAKLPHDVHFGSVYVTPKGHRFVDTWYEVLDVPRVFEWNVMHHRDTLARSCVDIDGVLCRDPTEWENDDGPRYREFLSTVRPSVVPTHTIGWLVTCRLEKYRGITEEWMRRNNISYGQLVMMDLPDKQTRLKSANHAHFKASVYQRADATLFIESSLQQAEEILKISRKSVLCIETGEMLEASNQEHARQVARRLLRATHNSPPDALRVAVRSAGARMTGIAWKAVAEMKTRWRRRMQG